MKVADVLGAEPPWDEMSPAAHLRAAQGWADHAARNGSESDPSWRLAGLHLQAATVIVQLSTAAATQAAAAQTALPPKSNEEMLRAVEGLGADLQQALGLLDRIESKT